MLVTVFYELKGKQAQTQLEASALALEAFGIEATLLASRDQPNLYLLTFECTEDDTLPAAPASAKVWRFQALP